MSAPENAVRCVACNGPIKHIEGKPYECADCGRNLLQGEGIRHDAHWDIKGGWLVYELYGPDSDLDGVVTRKTARTSAAELQEALGLLAIDMTRASELIRSVAAQLQECADDFTDWDDDRDDNE